MASDDKKNSAPQKPFQAFVDDALLLFNQNKEENNNDGTAADSDRSIEIYRVPKSSSDDNKLSAKSSEEESNLVYY